MKLKCGFIGIGAMGRSHVDLIHRENGERAEVVSVCGNNEDNIKKCLEIAPDAVVYHDEDELIQSDVDAVFISTPNFTHIRLAKAVIEAGKHLFLEKPCGITLAECDELGELAKATDKIMKDGELCLRM